MRKFIRAHIGFMLTTIIIVLMLIIAGFTSHISRPHAGAITEERYLRNRDEDIQKQMEERSERNMQIQRIEDKVDEILLNLAPKGG